MNIITQILSYITIMTCIVFWGDVLGKIFRQIYNYYQRKVSWKTKKGKHVKNFLDFYFDYPCPNYFIEPSVICVKEISHKVFRHFNFPLSPYISGSIYSLKFIDEDAKQTIKGICNLNQIQFQAYIEKWFSEEYKIPKEIKFIWN